jgi:hypothetical protein
MCHMRRVPQARQEALRLRAMGLADVGQHRHGAVVGASIAGYLEGRMLEMQPRRRRGGH